MAFESDTMRRAVPPLQGRAILDGIAGPVDIFRDAWGIPHIRAGSAADAFFAQGFAHAQDRLWQMDAARRPANHRAGPGDQAALRRRRPATA